MRTRVLFFTPTLASGGADRVTITLLRHLDRAKFELSIALLRREGSFVGEIPPDVRVIELGARRLAVSVPALVRVLRAERPDVVFAMQGGANIVAATSHALARSKARLVVSERSALRRDDRSAKRLALELPAKQVSYRRADAVTAVSRGVANALVSELGLPEHKVHVVYNPLVDDETRRQATEPVDHPWFSTDSGDIPVLLAIGRLVSIKDYPTMLRAFALLRASRRIRLFVLGEGPLHRELEAEAAKLGLADDVVFHGFDPNPFKYLARAALLIHSSRAEGLPGGIIQAMSCGLPVVSTDADFGPREVIDDGVSGFLVPVGDADALADRTARLLDDPALRSRTGEAARTSAERFTTAAAMARYEAAILGTESTSATSDRDPREIAAASGTGSTSATSVPQRTVTFVFTNPKHHVDMMVPVASKLVAQGERVAFVSLAELRGFATPDLAARVPGVTVKRALPRWIRKDPSVGAGLGESGGAGAAARTTAQQIAWHAVLGPLLRWHLRDADLVVLPNDAAFPYGHIANRLRRDHVPFVLLQEGIRFPLPREQAAGKPYGGGGAAAVCAWGEASAEHFRKIGANVRVTGTPRYDDVDPSQWRARGAALQAKLGLAQKPLLFLSNTVDDQGFCTTAEKYELFASFVERAARVLGSRPIVVKLHPRESVKAFRDVAARFPHANVHVLDGSEHLFEVLAMGKAAVVLASTVGLEALAFGLPLGVLALPNHGHVFEYVERGAAVGLTLDNLASELPALVDERPHATNDVFLERHLAHRGHAADRIASTLLELRQRRSS